MIDFVSELECSDGNGAINKYSDSETVNLFKSY